MFPVAPMENDQSEFLEIITHVIKQIIQELQPKDICLIRTDHWFDSKWLAFSGKIMGAVAVSNKRLTLPPFVPNRVLSQQTYSFVDESSFYQETHISPLHRVQPSRQNLTRFIDLISKSGLFVWFSGGTKQNIQASLMVYNIADTSQSAWYASFHKTSAWQINKVQGFSKDQLQFLTGLRAG